MPVSGEAQKNEHDPPRTIPRKLYSLSTIVKMGNLSGSYLAPQMGFFAIKGDL